jgi:hypothetical protein
VRRLLQKHRQRQAFRGGSNFQQPIARIWHCPSGCTASSMPKQDRFVCSYRRRKTFISQYLKGI